MFSGYKRNNLIILVVGAFLGVVAATVFNPIYQNVLQAIYDKEFSRLTEQCDQAMRTHLLAKNSLDIQPSLENVSFLKSSELGLLVCQDYDFLRKKLIRLGVEENTLSEMTLRYIENYASDLQLVIKTHEFSY
jgi:hypothetical protein